MRSITTSSDSNPSANKIHAKLTVSLAGTPQEIREAQRLRHRVFTETFQLSERISCHELNIDDV